MSLRQIPQIPPTPVVPLLNFKMLFSQSPSGRLNFARPVILVMGGTTQDIQQHGSPRPCPRGSLTIRPSIHVTLYTANLSVGVSLARLVFPASDPAR